MNPGKKLIKVKIGVYLSTRMKDSFISQPTRNTSKFSTTGKDARRNSATFRPPPLKRHFMKKNSLHESFGVHYCQQTSVFEGPNKKAVLRRRALIHLVPRDGIEPPTRGFSVLCSTN